jgi:uncharacterized repeat protein (TIGR04076 family)
MKKVKITVLETMFNEKLAKQYGAPGLGPCPFHKVGEEFFTIMGEKPEKLCDEAWSAIKHYAFALCSGSEGFWEFWIETRNLSINSCNDGLRPVIFKIERIEE